MSVMRRIQRAQQERNSQGASLPWPQTSEILYQKMTTNQKRKQKGSLEKTNVRLNEAVSWRQYRMENLEWAGQGRESLNAQHHSGFVSGSVVSKGEKRKHTTIRHMTHSWWTHDEQFVPSVFERFRLHSFTKLISRFKLWLCQWSQQRLWWRERTQTKRLCSSSPRRQQQQHLPSERLASPPHRWAVSSQEEGMRVNDLGKERYKDRRRQEVNATNRHSIVFFLGGDLHLHRDLY